MRKICLISIFLILIGFSAFGAPESHEEVDFLLFSPNSSNQFANEALSAIQLDNLANYLKGRNLAPGQIYVYGYAAFAVNDVEPMDLSRGRALFVISELERRGVPRDLFAEPVGHGSVDLWGSNVDEMNRSPNRRVRILVDGSFLTVEVIEPEIEAPAVEEKTETLTVNEDKTTEKKKFEFPWIVLLLPLLLLPFLFFLLSKRRKKTEKSAKPETAVPVTKAPEPAAEAPVAAKAPEPARVTPVVTAVPAAAPVTTDESFVYLEEEIRLRAYELYKDCNGQNEDADRDWYIALPEVCARYESQGYQTYKEDGCWWAHKKFIVSNR